MRKKLLICFVCFIGLFMVDTVKAAESCDPVSPTLYKIAGNNSQSMRVYISPGDYKTGDFYKQRINGNWALCLVMGNSSSSTYSFNVTPVEETEYNTYTIKRAYQFLMSHRSGSQDDVDLAYTLSQVVIWLSQNGIVSNTSVRMALTSAFCSAFTYTYASEGCSPSQEGYRHTAKLYKDRIDEYMSDWTSTFAYKGKLGVYYSDVAGSQPLLSVYKCAATCEETNSCPSEIVKPPAPTCKYTLDVNVPDSCDVSNSGYVNDMKDWKCIFKSQTSSDNNIKEHYVEPAIDDSTNNPYCASYCREEVSWTYPDSGTEVYQGRFMTLLNSISGVPSIQPIEYHGKKECRVTDKLSSDLGTINWKKFVSDYNSLNGREQSLWDDANNKYKIWKAYLDASTKPNGKYVCHTTAYSDGFEGSDGSSNTSHASMGAARDDARENCESANDDIRDAFSSCQDDCDEERDEAIANKKPVPSCSCTMGSLHNCGNISDGTSSMCERFGTGTYCHNEYGCDSEAYIWSNYYYDESARIGQAASAYSSARSAYINNSNSRTTVINQIRACSDPHVEYELNPELGFEYEEPIYGTEFDLDKTTSNGESITYFVGGSSSTNGGSARGSVPQSEQIAYKNCGGSGGTASARSRGNGNSIANDRSDVPSGQRCGADKQFTYPITDWWKYILTSNVAYQWNDNIYRYINKIDGSSISNPTGNYIDIGFSVLPIHYSTMPGTYDFRVMLTSGDFGDDSKLSKFVFTNTAFDGKKYGVQSTIYGCTYRVRCQRPVVITDCDTYTNSTCHGQVTTCSDSESGLNLIYRTISLYSKTDAFPGLNGNGRQPGFNWDDDNVIEKYIVKNRGVNDYSVYHLDPMYEITLTPAKIRTIRKYNKYMNTKTSNVISTKEPAILGYADFENMSCSNGKNCRSGFIRGTAVTSGTNSISSSELSGIKVTGCAINGTTKANGGSYSNCGNTEAW